MVSLRRNTGDDTPGREDSIDWGRGTRFYPISETTNQ